MELKENNNQYITVIIPLFNAEKYIGETIESVIEQTYQNWEMIVVDDCSTDSSRTIVKEYENQDSRIKLVESESNFGGPSRPRNIGLENAKGEYIAFLDADDTWLPNKLEKQMLFLKQNKVEFTSSDCILIDEKNEKVQLGFLSRVYNSFTKKKTICDVIKNNFILTSSVLIRKTLLKEFNEDKRYVAVEDFDMWLYVLANHENIYKYQNEKLISYRIVETSISNRKNIFNQELKANFVLANFVLQQSQYAKCYIKRIIVNFLIKFLK